MSRKLLFQLMFFFGGGIGYRMVVATSVNVIMQIILYFYLAAMSFSMVLEPSSRVTLRKKIRVKTKTHFYNKKLQQLKNITTHIPRQYPFSAHSRHSKSSSSHSVGSRCCRGSGDDGTSTSIPPELTATAGKSAAKTRTQKCRGGIFIVSRISHTSMLPKNSWAGFTCDKYPGGENA